MLQQQPPPHQQGQPQPQQQHGTGQRVFTGTVTKLHDNFGFVDEDVFFQTSVVKGQAPRVSVRFTSNPFFTFCAAVGILIIKNVKYELPAVRLFRGA